MKGYHTCKKDGGWNHVWRNGPFISEQNGPPKRWQWLSQGFYFWTDDPFYAKKWGELSYKNNFVILECSLKLDALNILDLVGNVSDQIHFNELIKMYEVKMNGKVDPTISTVIEHYRQQNKVEDYEGIFSYDGIKAQDGRAEEEFSFTPKSKETMLLVTRQQLCLFEHAKNAIINKKICYPDNFAEACLAAINAEKVGEYEQLSNDGPTIG